MNNIKNINNVCIVDSAYALLLYLLYQDEDRIDDTYYFSCKGIHPSIRKNFKNFYFFPHFPHGKIEVIKYILRFKVFRYFFFPYLRKCNFFAQDHVPFARYIIGNNNYTLLEEAKTMFTFFYKVGMITNSNRIRKSLSKRAKWVSEASYSCLGNNSLCNQIIVTSDDYDKYISGKTVKMVSFKELWDRSSGRKKELILKYFNINPSLDLSSKTVILLTQTFYDDGELTEEEHYQVYKTIIDDLSLRFDKSKILIKPHPRESFDYQKKFKDVTVFNTVVPLQLLDLIGCHFECAATITSTSVETIPYELEIKWYGAKVHEKLYNRYGDFVLKEK